MGLYKYEGIPEDELETRLKNVRNRITDLIDDPVLTSLVNHVLDYYGLDLCESVGSATKHHNLPGQLMTHTFEVVELARAMGTYYSSKVNMDLITTGAFLHDIGKIVCYEDTPNLKSGARPKKRFKGSEQSKMKGHFGEALIMIEGIVRLEDIPIPKETLDHLYHIISSHHGEARLNWGSIVDPNTNEAHIVALADLLSSRVK